MPERGFSVLTVKDQHADLLRSCYRSLIEGSGLPVILDKVTYDRASEAVGGGEAESVDDLVRVAVLQRLAKGKVTIVVPDGLVKIMRDLLKSEWYRKYHAPRTLEEIALRAIEQYLYRYIEHEIPKSYELIYQVSGKLFLVGVKGVRESILTWMQVVGTVLWRKEPPKIMQWHVREKWMAPDEYHIYTGAKFQDEVYIMAIGEIGHDEVARYIKDWKLPTELRPGDDPTIQNFLRNTQEFHKRPEVERRRLTYNLQELSERIRRMIYKEE